MADATGSMLYRFPSFLLQNELMETVNNKTISCCNYSLQKVTNSAGKGSLVNFSCIFLKQMKQENNEKGISLLSRQSFQV